MLHTCPIPEVARLGRTLRQWRQQILAYFATGGVNNGGIRNFDNYRLRILLAADGSVRSLPGSVGVAQSKHTHDWRIWMRRLSITAAVF